jgi:hypothetical protein
MSDLPATIIQDGPVLSDPYMKRVHGPITAQKRRTDSAWVPESRITRSILLSDLALQLHLCPVTCMWEVAPMIRHAAARACPYPLCATCAAYVPMACLLVDKRTGYLLRRAPRHVVVIPRCRSYIHGPIEKSGSMNIDLYPCLFIYEIITTLVQLVRGRCSRLHSSEFISF